MKKILAVGLVLLILVTGCQPNQTDTATPPETQANEYTTDIVIVGSGLSGLSTSISALEAGASVILVEKAPVLGATFFTSKGNIMNAMVEENEEAHITESDDTLDAALDRWKIWANMANDGPDHVDYDRVKTVLIESAKTVKWLEDMGVNMEPSFTYEQRGEDVAKVVQQGDEVEGRTLITSLEERFDELGGVKLVSTNATELLVTDGEVTGIKAEQNGEPVTIHAKKTVLATGGFGGNPDLLEEKIPNLKDTGYIFSGNPENVGAGELMAKAAHAQIYTTAWIIPSPGILLPDEALIAEDGNFRKLNNFSPFAMNLIQSHILVNGEGERFVDESLSGVEISSAILDHRLNPVYLVLDDTNADIVDLLEQHLNSEKVIKLEGDFDTLPALSETLAAVGTNADPYPKDPDLAHPYEGDTIYLVKMVPDFVATIGGVVTNADNQVLAEDGEPIGNLYAVGELAHQFMYNRAHFANASNSASLSLGRLLGQTLAEEAK